MAELGDYKLRKGARLAYNDGTGPKVAHEGETVKIPTHLAEGEFAARLEYPDGRPVVRSRWSLADINRATPTERGPIIQQRLARLESERAELERLQATTQADATKQAAATAARRANLKGE